MTSNKQIAVVPATMTADHNNKQEPTMLKHESAFPKLVRQESFKRSRSFNQKSQDLSVEKLDEALEGLNLPAAQPEISEIAKPEMMVKEHLAVRGMKRSAEQRNINIRTPFDMEISGKIVNYLTLEYVGHVEPKPVFIAASGPPSISFLKYIQRIIKFTNQYTEEADGPDSIGVRCAAIALEYIDRADLKIDENSVHRCFLIAYLVGLKFIYDFYMSNSFWGQVGGLPMKEVNAMEIVFCEALGWNFSVTPEHHEKRLVALVSL